MLHELPRQSRIVPAFENVPIFDACPGQLRLWHGGRLVGWVQKVSASLFDKKRLGVLSRLGKAMERIFALAMVIRLFASESTGKVWGGGVRKKVKVMFMQLQFKGASGILTRSMVLGVLQRTPLHTKCRL